jgi:hypothetical protein
LSPGVRAAARIGVGWIVAAAVLYFTRFRKSGAARPDKV